MSDSKEPSNLQKFLASRGAPRAANNNNTIMVDVKVPPGFQCRALNTQSIGTDGCGPCVAVIATLSDGTIFCGHLACDIAANTDENKDKIRARTRLCMTGQMLTSTAVQRIWVASLFQDASSLLIRDTLIEMFASQITVDRAMGLWWSPNHRDVGVVEDNTYLASHGAAPAMGVFEIQRN